MRQRAIKLGENINKFDKLVTESVGQVAEWSKSSLLRSSTWSERFVVETLAR